MFDEEDIICWFVFANMPLFVGEKEVLGIPDSIVEFHDTNDTLKESTEKLYKEDYRTTPGQKLLYVCQREYAVVPPEDECVDIIGSEDATTCHLLVIRHSGSNVCGLGHLDGLKTTEFVENMTKDVLALSVGGPEGRLEVHVVGGFLDDRKESIKLSRDLLDVLVKATDEYHLITFFCTDLNDTVPDGIHYPIVYGIGVEVKTGKLFPAKFPDRGPDMNIRGALCFAGYEKIHNVYDSKKKHLVVGPYYWEPQENADKYAALPSHVIRKYLSTSPEQEPAHFEDHVRSAFLTLHAHPEPHKSLFRNNTPRLYSKSDTGQWTRVNPDT